jgi:hypothetical protein
MDTYETDAGDRLGTPVEYVAQPLECGHDAGDGGGAPYRGRIRTDPRLMQRVVELQRGAS